MRRAKSKYRVSSSREVLMIWLPVERRISDLKSHRRGNRSQWLEASKPHIASACVHSDCENQEHINTRFIKTQAGISYQTFIRKRDETLLFLFTQQSMLILFGDMAQTHTAELRSLLIKIKLTQKQRCCRYALTVWLIRFGEGSSKSPCAMRKDQNRKTIADVGWFTQKEVKTNRPHTSELLFFRWRIINYRFVRLFFRRKNKFNWNQVALCGKGWQAMCENYLNEFICLTMECELYLCRSENT